MSKQVNVLISTYNGEKYLKEQIDSILNQTYKNIHIYIRDDASTDNTRAVLQEYMNFSNITIEFGNNIGYGGSFLSLLELAKEGDYWAFCDQDDVWLKNKVEIAVEWLSKQDESQPCLFHSSYYNTDEDLNIIEQIGEPEYQYDFVRAITECIHMGFSEMMNRALRELVLKADKNNLITHDWWTELVAMKFASVYYSPEPMSYHRRLKSSISANTFKARFRWLSKAWKGNAEIRTCTKEFERVFGKKQNDRDYRINRWFCFERYSFLKSLKKCFYWRRWRPSWSSEIIVRILMMCGKI